MRPPIRILSESEAGLASFHDCHAHGLRWRRDQFRFTVELQYILQWIPPKDGTAEYRFSICEAQVVFHGVSDLKVAMDWSRAGLDAEIAEISVLESRSTPNGSTERHFEISFANLEGSISLWSTGYHISLLNEPVISTTQTLPLSD
jgi:hypothetical protein